MRIFSGWGFSVLIFLGVFAGIAETACAAGVPKSVQAFELPNHLRVYVKELLMKHVLIQLLDILI